MVGANFLVNMSEVTVAYGVYKAMGKISPDTFSKAAIGTLAGLFTGNVILVAIILISGIQGVNQTRTEMLYGLSLLVAVNMGIAIIESIVTGYAVSYIQRVRPDMLQEVIPIAATAK